MSVSVAASDEGASAVLILAEGKIHRPVEGAEQRAVAAWLGPMADAGFLQSGYLDASGERVIMILSAPDLAAADQRLADLPPARDGSVSFHTTRITALRLT